MAQFFRGQRARVIDGPALVYKHWAGSEVTILGLPGAFKDRPDNYEISAPKGEPDREPWRYSAPAELLAPLTDPSAERFIESIKKLGREPINDAPKVTVTK